MLGLQHLCTAGVDHVLHDSNLLQHGSHLLWVWGVVVSPPRIRDAVRLSTKDRK